MLVPMKTIIATLLLAASFALPAQAEEARAMVEDYFGGLDTLAGDFSQEVTDPEGRVVEEAHGRVYLSLPDRFRWDYTDPYEQVIVADGRRVWLYDVELEQVTVRDQDETAKDSPMLVLTDTALMDEFFETQELGRRDGQEWLRMLPKDEESQFQSVDVAVDAEGLRCMIFRDRFGQVTELKFSNLERNADLEEDKFQFTPPEGVDVIGDGSSVRSEPLE